MRWEVTQTEPFAGYDLRLTWAITPHVLTLFEFGIFTPGSAIRTAGGHVTTFLDANLTFKF